MAPEMVDPPSNTVCVMDASGRLGSTLVERLLRRGYTVHAAIQKQGELGAGISDPSIDKRKLKIFRSDMFDYHSIIDALKGCSGLFYTFEPLEDQSSYDEYMAEVEVRAAHNVLEACAQIETIDKVVFTSSVTAVVWRDDHASLDADFDERHWSNINLCRKYKLWHGLSKTLAEKAAWALAMDRGVNMVSVNGGLLLGPDLSMANPYLKGAAETYEDGLLVTVDLDYLVDAHVCVFEDVSSYGRYLCFNNVLTRQEDALKLAQMLAPGVVTPPPSEADQETKIIEQRISNKKMNKLMVNFVTESSTI